MKDYYFLLADKEAKKLFDQFAKIHSDGSDMVLKLLLKFYVKFAKWHKRKGRNPIIAFQDLIEREIQGKPYSTDVERIKYLNEIIEKSEENNSLPNDELLKEIKTIKNIFSTMELKTGPKPSLDDFAPTTGDGLVKVADAKPKKRKSYRDIRKKGGTAKKIL